MYQTYLRHSRCYVCRIQEVERERERKREVEREVTQQIVAGLTFAVPSFASKWYLSNLLDVKTNEDGDGRKMRERRS